MLSIINPYRKGVSLIFFGAPHDMDPPINCQICQPIETYEDGDIIQLCPEMKKFCCNSLTELAIRPVPKDAKSWNIMVGLTSDDEPDIIPIFHTIPHYGELLEQTSINLKDRREEKKHLEIKIKNTEEQIKQLIEFKKRFLKDAI